MQDQNEPTVVQDAPEPQEAPQEQPVAQEEQVPQEQVEQAPEPTQQSVVPSQEAPAYDPADIDISQYRPQQVQQVQPDEDGFINPEAYRQSILQEVEQRIALAGCRLAGLMNQIDFPNDSITAPKNRVASPPVIAR